MGKIEERLRADARAAKAKKEEEQNNANRIEGLQQFYLFYTVIEVCAERFSDFRNARSILGDFIKTKEAGLPSQLVKEARERFKKMALIMKMLGDVEHYMQCDQTSKYAAGLMMFDQGMGEATQGHR